MHDIKWIRDHVEAFDRSLARRNVLESDRRSIIDQLLSLDARRRAVIGRLEQAQARRNAASKEIGEAKKGRDEARAQALMAEVAGLKTTIQEAEAEEREVVETLDGALAELPNMPLDEVPDGKDEHDNVEHHRFGARRNYAFTPKQHFELGEALRLMDFETAAKLSGARFVVLKGALARLERALTQFMLDLHVTEHGYTEVAPPLMVRDHVMYGTGQLPKFRDDQFVVTNDSELREMVGKAAATSDPGGIALTMKDRSRWLIPTAEVPLTNLAREQILDEAVLPLRFTAGTPCFRAEAGAAGKDTRGMIRQHQFTKVELVSITTAEQSRDEHERMLACAEEVLRRLDLHYRVVTLCAGDMGFASQKTFDIEVWLPGQGAFREISSCSVCGEFQARRMDARYRSREGRAIHYVHTLNGSGVAVGRALIAVMETYQEADGSITVPDALQPYLRGMTRIEKAA